MPPILIYLLRLSISLAVVWLFYQLLLRRLTFYGLNRWYLLGYSALSFFIPLINIYPILREKEPAEESYLIQLIPVVGGQGRGVAAQTHESMHWWTWLIGTFALGALVLLIRLVIRGLSLYRLRKSARLMEGTALKIYQVDAPIIPFSFGHSIYINRHLHTEQQLADIILHEYVHIKQRHTLDILLSELICVLNWYNPFSWLMRRSIRQNLEFIADQQVLGSGVDRKEYQYHLLTVLGEPQYRLANNFNFSSLKKRIVMMNKMRSARLHLLKFLFVLPLVGVLLVAFRDATEMERTSFEKLYGRLPERVPPPGNNTDEQEKAARSGGKIMIGSGTIGAVSEGAKKDTVPASNTRKLPTNVLYVIDGEKMPAGWTTNKLPADSIGSIVVLKAGKALTFFGPSGENGAVVIRTKAYEAAHPMVKKDDEKPGNPAVLFGDSAGAVPYRAGSITMNGVSHVEGNGQATGVANGPREGQAQVTFDNGKQVAIADTIKMNGLIITTYHPGGN